MLYLTKCKLRSKQWKGWKKKTAFLSFVILLLVSCGDRVGINDIPHTDVNFTCPINTNNLIHVGGYEYFSGGISGIIVYRLDISSFLSYDRACPYDWRDNGYVVYNSATLQLVCQKCGSAFNILDGSPMNNSNAKTFLRTYNARMIDDMTLHVYN